MAEEKNVVSASTIELGTRISEAASKVGGKKNLAHMIGISESQLYRYINGSSSPTIEPLVAISKVADLPISWLIEGKKGQTEKREETVKNTPNYQDTRKIDQKIESVDPHQVVDLLTKNKYLSEADIELLQTLASIISDRFLLERIAERLSFDSKSVSLLEEFSLIPGYNVQVSAGAGSYPLSETPSRYLAFRRKWLRYKGLYEKNLALVFVHGDSMEPTISDNNTVLIDTSKKELHDGEIYVLRTDNHLIIKRVQRLLGDVIRLISDNKIYDPIEVLISKDPNFQVIGKVEWIGKDA